MKIDKIITKKEQEVMTPDQVLNSLLEGNERFVNEKLNDKNNKALVESATGGQNPRAIVLSCVDSRVPVETVLDQAIGDIFVSRVAGNFENTDILGSMEYACKVAGSKLVFVLGHESCGAVSAACDFVEVGNITSMLENIKPAVNAVEVSGEKSSKNPDFVQAVVEKNVKLTMDRIREKSSILNEMESNGEIKIVGGVYSLKTGKIEML